MAYSEDMNSVIDKTLNKRANSLTRWAHLQLFWEIYAPTLALGVLFLLLYWIGASFGVWQRIGDPWRLIALIAVLYFLAKSILKTRKCRMPTKSQAQRRVEHDNGFRHRPLDVLTDTPASNTEKLAWRSHVLKAKAQVENAKFSKLRPALSPIDPYYFRFIIPVLFILALMVGSGDNYERLRASLTPKWLSATSFKTASFEAWIDPPQYTSRPPSYFKNIDRMNAPEGSEFVARISGVKTAPRLILREGAKTRRITPKRLGPKSFEARAIVNNDSTASYRIGNKVKKWHLKIGKDTPPIVKFDDKPEAGKRDKLEFSYTIHDDFGVEWLYLSYHLKFAPTPLPMIVEQSPIPIPGSTVRNAEKELASLDLTKHKWAGKEVIGHLVAIDGKKQEGVSKDFEFIVPDKIFVEPLAKAIAEQRVLILNGTQPYKPLPKIKATPENKRPMFETEHPDLTIERAPKSIRRAALLIDVITDKPVGVFEDPAIYMGLRNVYRRIQTADEIAELGGIPEDLWDIAIRAEYGRLGDAKEDMMRAERALNNAMARRAPQREIDTLFERYNKAVDRYIEELTLKAIKEAAKRDKKDGNEGGGDSDFNTDQIQALLDAIEEANRMGDTVAARKALAKLAELLKNMQIQLAEGGGGSGKGLGEGGMSEEMKKALEELNDMLGKQRQLRDETQNAGRDKSDRQSSGNSQNGAQQPKSGGELAVQQRTLRELMENLEKNAKNTKNGGDDDQDGNRSEEQNTENGKSSGGNKNADGNKSTGGDENLSVLLNDDKIRNALKDAKDAMNRSENALGNEEFYQASREQSKAIEALRRAGEGLFAEEAKRLQEQNDKKQQTGGDGDDPFGRENDGTGVGDGIEIPEIDDRQRARDLLEKLRKRSGEQERDKVERDYLDRLLERF